MTTDPATAVPADRPLYRWERVALLALVPLAVGFGAITLCRSAFFDTRKTDYGVYARAAWAVRAGEDLYRTHDDNGWHYVYPPTFVFLFLPVADPPAWESRDGYVPYPIGVAVWYLVGVGLIAYSVHSLAGVCASAVPWSRRWWYARVLPFDVCVGGLGFTLSRGQANILLVALIAAMFSAAVRRKSVRSGAFLAAAACLKVFPGLLVLFPVMRREWRSAVGFAAGGAALLFVLPALAWGPGGAIRENVRFVKLVVAPGLFDADGMSEQDKLLATELHNMTAKDSQSFLATLHYWRYPDPMTRPDHPDPDVRRFHWLLSAAAVLLTVGAAELARRTRTLNAADWLVFLGALIAVMLLVVPVSHMHYYAILLPFAAGLVCQSLAADRRRAVPDRVTLVALFGWMIATNLPLLDGEPFVWMRTGGVAPVATLALWAFGVWRLAKGVRVAEVKTGATESVVYEAVIPATRSAYAGVES